MIENRLVMVIYCWIHGSGWLLDIGIITVTDFIIEIDDKILPVYRCVQNKHDRPEMFGSDQGWSTCHWYLATTTSSICCPPICLSVRLSISQSVCLCPCLSFSPPTTGLWYAALWNEWDASWQSNTRVIARRSPSSGLPKCQSLWHSAAKTTLQVAQCQ